MLWFDKVVLLLYYCPTDRLNQRVKCYQYNMAEGRKVFYPNLLGRSFSCKVKYLHLVSRISSEGEPDTGLSIGT